MATTREGRREVEGGLMMDKVSSQPPQKGTYFVFVRRKRELIIELNQSGNHPQHKCAAFLSEYS